MATPSFITKCSRRACNEFQNGGPQLPRIPTVKLLQALLISVMLGRCSGDYAFDDECHVPSMRISQTSSLVQGPSAAQRVVESLDEEPRGVEFPQSSPTAPGKTQKSSVGDDASSVITNLQAHFHSFAQRMLLLDVGRAKSHGRLLATIFIVAVVLMCSGVCFVAYAGTGGTKQRSAPLNSGVNNHIQSQPRAMAGSPLQSAYQGQRNQAADTPSTRGNAPVDGHAHQHPSICRELVVPEGSECSLKLPRLPPMGAGNAGNVSVDAMGPGGAIFVAQFDCDPRPRNNARLVVGSATNQSVYATCRDALDEGGGLMIHDRQDQLLGVLRADDPERSSYHLLFRTGGRINFRGDIRSGAITITDDKGRLMATAERQHPAGGSRCVKVGPLVDAGLVVVTILGIDLIEHNARQPSKRPS